MNEGRIIARHGQNLWLQSKEQIYFCLKLKNVPELVCGDRVIWQPTAEGQGVITRLLPRTNVLSRQLLNGQRRPLAANIDQILIVLAPQPEPNHYLLDQYLVAAELLPAQACIIWNKIDLAQDWPAQKIYQKLDYPIIPISARTGQGLADLQSRLCGCTSILLGQSGVGKSSLLNALLGEKKERIGDLASKGQGKHTTTVARLYPYLNGALIDSPGVRSFRLGRLSMAQWQAGFKEIKARSIHCRFNNCRHLNEPGCAVLNAVQQGLIAKHRWQHYQKLSF